jgi:hypothetical protein
VQELVDRRIAQHGGLPAHALLATTDATVDGARGARIEYAYVVRPTGGAQRQAVPVVALAREYVVVTAEGVYYIALAAPEGEAPGAFARFERIIGEVSVR